MYGMDIKYEDLIKFIDRYYDFSFDVFDWAIEKIYPEDKFPYVNCSFEISPIELRNNIGRRVYGNSSSGLINIYLYNIIYDNISLGVNDLKVLIISVIVHELFHLNQNKYKDNRSVSSFKIDDDYESRVRFVEHPVIQKTLEFLDINMHEICEKFKVRYNRATIEHFNIPNDIYMMRTNTYNSNTPEIFWVDLITSLFNKKELDQDLISIIESNSTVSINVKYNGYRNFEDDDVYIKKDNEYYAPSVELVHNIRKIKEGISGSYSYNIYALKDQPRIRIVIEYKLDLFKPIERIEE